MNKSLLKVVVVAGLASVLAACSASSHGDHMSGDGMGAGAHSSADAGMAGEHSGHSGGHAGNCPMTWTATD